MARESLVRVIFPDETPRNDEARSYHSSGLSFVPAFTIPCWVCPEGGLALIYLRCPGLRLPSPRLYLCTPHRSRLTPGTSPMHV